ncbi:hypothetical protein [Croceicoccus mobilis]|uniref:Uncharacterized protein n=1 Tax=Croceicoccus mobilis TaxID=1703339 RepID=A0A916Z1A7_9SPHN|nr:hypothetical protein [Croceicoccus mobilis]GGD71353.1 hypothetical protein GCM10010990_21070 [Croceicoccus mobilis]
MPARLFGWLHLAQIGVFALGLAALFAPRLRAAYALLACLGLMALPVEAQLVHAGTLTCDMP